MLGLRFCARAFSSCGRRGPLPITVCGPLTATVPPVAEHRLQMRRLSSCGSRAQLLHGMWDPPRPGPKPVSPALAGRLPTTAPPGKPSYRTFYPKAAKYTFFSSAHRTFFRIDHMLDHKTSLNKFKKIEIISSIFVDHDGMRWEIKYKEKENCIKHKHMEAKQYATKQAMDFLKNQRGNFSKTWVGEGVCEQFGEKRLIRKIYNSYQKNTLFFFKWAEGENRPFFPKKTHKWPTDTWNDVQHC